MGKFQFSLIFKIMFILIEIIFIGNAIYNIKNEIYISIGCFIIVVILFIIDNCFFSLIAFKNEIVIINKLQVKRIKYSEIKRIEISKSIAHAFLIGADIDINIVLKNNVVKKVHLGPIVRYNKLISMIKEVAKYRCIKFCLND